MRLDRLSHDFSLAHSSTGIEGLDNVPAGGLTPKPLYGLKGVPGTDETKVARQFLLKGVRRDNVRARSRP
jgi:circadian clock protein KaiC